MRPELGRNPCLARDRNACSFGCPFFCGDKRDRTADLMTASHALSQSVRLHTPVTGDWDSASTRRYTTDFVNERRPNETMDGVFV